VLTAFCLFLPTTINETKITIFLLPAAFFLPAILNQERMGAARVKRLLVMSILTIIFISVFVMSYYYMTTFKPQFKEKRPPISKFFKDRKTLESYLYRGVDEGSYGELHRLDRIVLTYKYLAENIKSFSFGFGIGSATRSHFGTLRNMHIKARRYGADSTTLTYLFWEFGLLGVIVYTCFFVFIFKDALVLKKHDDIFGTFALGWCPTAIIIGICLIYLNLVVVNVLNLCFWYFSGLIAAKTVLVKKLPEKNERQHA
jgi:hypothetical protein